MDCINADVNILESSGTCVRGDGAIAPGTVVKAEDVDAPVNRWLPGFDATLWFWEMMDVMAAARAAVKLGSDVMAAVAAVTDSCNDTVAAGTRSKGLGGAGPALCGCC